MSSSLRAARRLLVVVTTLGIAASCGGGGGGSSGYGNGLVDGASVTPTAIQAAQSSFPGEFAGDFLRRTIFTSLLVEIDYAAGHPPSQEAMDLLQDRLAEVCDKPGGVTILQDDAIPLADIPSSTSVSELEDLEAIWRDHYADANTQEAVLYFLYVTGQSDLGGGPSTQILGLTYHGSSIALYVEVADQGSNPFETTEEVEGMAIVHEAGHALGLVNGGVPMVVEHEDGLHDGHDDDEASAMYWLIQIDPVAPNIGDATFAIYGANCEADLAAAGGLPAAPPARIAAVTRAAWPRTVVGTCGGCASRARAAAAGAPGCPTR
jgi:hypothetical protein